MGVAQPRPANPEEPKNRNMFLVGLLSFFDEISQNIHPQRLERGVNHLNI